MRTTTVVNLIVLGSGDDLLVQVFSNGRFYKWIRQVIRIIKRTMNIKDVLLTY